MRMFVRPKYRTVDSFQQFLSQLMPGDTVFTDIDETLMHPVGQSSHDNRQIIGSSSWFSFYQQYLTKHHCVESALPTAVGVFSALQSSLMHREVEAGTIVKLRAMQQQGVRFIGLTARDAGMNSVTHKKLSSLGYALDQPGDDSHFSLSLPQSNGQAVQYDRGIIFCSGNDKGAVLRALYESKYRQQFFHGNLFFIDDSERNCRQVANAFGGDQLPDVLASHYRYVAKNFTPYCADQFEQDRERVERIVLTLAADSTQQAESLNDDLSLYKKCA